MVHSTTAVHSTPSPASYVDQRPRYERRRNEVAGSERVSRLQVPDANELDPRLAEVHAEFVATHGFVPNWLSALSINPDTALRLVQFYRHLFDPARSRLSAAERELIAVVSSA